MLKTRIAVFVSGGGTNLQALIDAEKSGIIKSGEIVLVVSSSPTAYALERAKNAGIPGKVADRKGGHFEEELRAYLAEYKVDMIVLAGFMSILSKEFTRDWDHRILNVHPALIPSFCGEGMYGLRPHIAALEKGVKVTGATVHFVNEVADGGEIILQKAVEVCDGDTPERLQRRVMEQAEWIILPAATEKIAEQIEKEKNLGGEIMSTYSVNDLNTLLSSNVYPGRGIVTGLSADGKKAVAAYFIMGRSANSRNRIFTEKNGEIFTEPFDLTRVEDPSLIIYAAVRQFENNLIVTNGDQTDTVYEGLKAGMSFEEALTSREFEPDAPNLTPRISSMLTFKNGKFTYAMSILKSADEKGTGCNRFSFRYAPVAGVGHFLHTYRCDGTPIPTFEGEPERVALCDDIDELTNAIWTGLNEANKISLWVRMVDLATGETEERIVNKN